MIWSDCDVGVVVYERMVVCMVSSVAFSVFSENYYSEIRDFRAGSKI